LSGLSVAKTLNQSTGIKGKRCSMVGNPQDNKREKTKYLLLENVDRLLKSPANKGRDFAIIWLH